MIIMALNVFGIVALPQSLFALVRNALGHLSADSASTCLSQSRRAPCGRLGCTWRFIWRLWRGPS